MHLDQALKFSGITKQTDGFSPVGKADIGVQFHFWKTSDHVEVIAAHSAAREKEPNMYFNASAILHCR